MALIDPATFPPRPVLFPKFRDRRKIRLVLLLGAALILEAILALIPYIKIRSTDIETRALTVDKSREEKKLETLRSRLLALEQELAILVQTRSPELYRFQLDRVIPINKCQVSPDHISPEQRARVVFPAMRGGLESG